MVSEHFHSSWVLLPSIWAWREMMGVMWVVWYMQAVGRSKRKKTRKWNFCLLDSEDRWACLPGEVSKVHIDTSTVEPGQKALLAALSTAQQGTGSTGSLISLVTGDLSLFACSCFTGNWFIEKTVSSRILGRCSWHRKIGFTGILNVIQSSKWGRFAV